MKQFVAILTMGLLIASPTLANQPTLPSGSSSGQEFTLPTFSDDVRLQGTQRRGPHNQGAGSGGGFSVKGSMGGGSYFKKPEVKAMIVYEQLL